jgi:hypothetical protein
MAIEQEYQRKTEIRQKKEEEAERARMKRREEIEKAWKQKDGSSFNGYFDVTIGGVVGGAVLAGSSFLGFRSNHPSGKEIRMAGMNIPGLDLAGYVDDKDILPDIDSGKAILPPKKSTNMDGTVRNNSVDIQKDTIDPPSTKYQQQTSLYGSPPVLFEYDRIEAARIGMVEYLERDDGGEDWLRMMNDIMEDADDVREGYDDRSGNDSIGISNSDGADGKKESQ